MWVGKKIHSILLPLICHFLRNFLALYTSLHINLCIFDTIQVIISQVWVIRKRLNVNWKKINSIILCHLSFLKKLYPIHTHPLISICEFSKPYELLLFWVWVICKRLNVNWKKIHPLILSVTCHSLRNFPPLIHIPSYPFMNFWNPTSFISWVLVICKRLNVNWKKFHSIILSVTYHSLRNFPSLMHIPHIHLWIFKTLWVIISWVWVIISHLSLRCDSSPPLYDTPHPYITYPTPTWPLPLHDPPTPAWHTAPLHDPPTPVPS